MCKIMVIPKVNDTEKAKRFMKVAQPFMAKKDPHGLGYAAVTEDNRLIMEKWREPEHAFNRPNNQFSGEKEAIKKLKSRLSKKQVEDFEYMNHGKMPEDFEADLKSIIYHTRMATCTKSLANVHPFVHPNGKTALIHNGKIDNPSQYEKYKPAVSTCDSESILNAYVYHKVYKDPKNFQEVSDKLRGYFALGIFHNVGGKFILDVVKDPGASLFVSYIPALKSEVFCTSAEIIKETCKKIGWKHGDIYTVEDNTFYRYCVDSQELIESTEFSRSSKSTYDYSNYNGYDESNWWKEDPYYGRTSGVNSKICAYDDVDKTMTLEEMETEIENIENVVEEMKSVLNDSSYDELEESETVELTEKDISNDGINQILQETSKYIEIEDELGNVVKAIKKVKVK